MFYLELIDDVVVALPLDVAHLRQEALAAIPVIDAVVWRYLT
jgi:hypothetical protein